MFDLGLTEIFVIAVLAILVIAPKDLPGAMRTAGQYMGKFRRMTREFQRQLNDAVRDEELDKLRREMSDYGRQTDAELRRNYARKSDVAKESGPAMTPQTKADEGEGAGAPADATAGANDADTPGSVPQQPQLARPVDAPAEPADAVPAKS